MQASPHELPTRSRAGSTVRRRSSRSFQCGSFAGCIGESCRNRPIQRLTLASLSDEVRAAAGQAIPDTGILAEFETALRRERQMEGIAKAKAAGVYKGRKLSIPVEEVRRLNAEGVAPSAIAKQLGVGRTSVYRALGMVE